MIKWFCSVILNFKQDYDQSLLEEFKIPLLQNINNTDLFVVYVKEIKRRTFNPKVKTVINNYLNLNPLNNQLLFDKLYK